jgi:hypothetical protein
MDGLTLGFFYDGKEECCAHVEFAAHTKNGTDCVFGKVLRGHSCLRGGRICFYIGDVLIELLRFERRLGA